jgi:hypothetical protein
LIMTTTDIFLPDVVILPYDGNDKC